MLVKVKKYNIRNGPIRWRISTSEHFLLALAVFQILAFPILRPWKYKSRSRCTTFAMVLLDDEYQPLYFIKVILAHFFASSHCFSHISIFNFVTLKIYNQGHDVHYSRILWPLHDILADGNLNVCHFLPFTKYTQI